MLESAVYWQRPGWEKRLLWLTHIATMLASSMSPDEIQGMIENEFRVLFEGGIDDGI